MGDEADAMWDQEMIEEGREFGNECLSQCNQWPSCACGYDTRKRPYDPCDRKRRTRNSSMTTPKEALEQLRDYLRGEAKKTDTCYTCYTDQAAFIATRLNTILASLEGDAVERVARIIIGPRLPVPDNCQFTLEELRSVRWSQSTKAEQQDALNAARATLATGLVPDEAAIRADSTANLISIIADIREKTGLGGKPMLNELADAIVAEMDRRVADEREKCAKITEDNERQDEWPLHGSEMQAPSRRMQIAIAAAIRSNERGA